jgi:hypothetical protein
MHLLIEHLHQRPGVLGTERLEHLGPDLMWWCVRRRNKRYDTLIVGPGDAVRVLSRGEAEKTETATRLPSGLLAVGLRHEVRLYDLTTLTPRGVLPCGKWVYHLCPLPNDRLLVWSSGELCPIWDLNTLEVVTQVNAREVGLLTVGTLPDDPDAVLLAGRGEAGPPWRATVWDALRGRAVYTVEVPVPEGAVAEVSDTILRPGTDTLYALVTILRGEERVTTLHQWANGHHLVMDEVVSPHPFAALSSLYFAAPHRLMVSGHRRDALWDLRDMTVRRDVRTLSLATNERTLTEDWSVLDLRTGQRVTIPSAAARRARGGAGFALDPTGERVAIGAGDELVRYRIVG